MTKSCAWTRREGRNSWMSYSTVGDPCFFTFGFASLPWQGLVQGGEWSVRCCFFIAILTIAPKDRSYLFCTVTVSAGETSVLASSRRLVPQQLHVCENAMLLVSYSCAPISAFSRLARPSARSAHGQTGLDARRIGTDPVAKHSAVQRSKDCHHWLLSGTPRRHRQQPSCSLRKQLRSLRSERKPVWSQWDHHNSASNS
jgi:hypothetical protein